MEKQRIAEGMQRILQKIKIIKKKKPISPVACSALPDSVAAVALNFCLRLPKFPGLLCREGRYSGVAPGSLEALQAASCYLQI